MVKSKDYVACNFSQYVDKAKLIHTTSSSFYSSALMKERSGFLCCFVPDGQKNILLDCSGSPRLLFTIDDLRPGLDLVTGACAEDDHADGAERGRDGEYHVPLLNRALPNKVAFLLNLSQIF